MSDWTDLDELRAWLNEGYAGSVRTAYLILGNRPDAEDAVQEAYLRAWKFRDSVVERSSFKPWLYRVVVNTCNSKLRKEIPHRDRRAPESDHAILDYADDPISRIALTQDVMRALADLPAHLRIVIVLRYYADLSEYDIAQVISRQPGTVKSRLSEARRRLAVHPALQSEAAPGPHPCEEQRP
ncbi:MAG TPA: RNA polymerase sigma factor [Acidimicrobiales bacterium]